ncbi:hypothetical protein IFM89_029737 [Coptis chinensis]|uniref:Survival protein SurE-like phosphatase/nucleotidase domain-containing protein n=1 Tax=Coptis chinensis TaxID=261450 RepID=A0A835I6F9_9MAGN|nr:hypothetical protein IFM89_029737 [Coptis chinensis]
MVYICEDETRYTISVQEIEDKNCVNSENDCSKPIVLVTNGDGIGAIGLTVLVEALVGVGLFNVHVYTPQFDLSVLKQCNAFIVGTSPLNWFPSPSSTGLSGLSGSHHEENDSNRGNGVHGCALQ